MSNAGVTLPSGDDDGSLEVVVLEAPPRLVKVREGV